MSTTSGPAIAEGPARTWALIVGLVAAAASLTGSASGHADRGEGPAVGDATRPDRPAIHLEKLWDIDLRPSGDVVSSASLADLDGDGRHEILVRCGARDEPSSVVAVDGDGVELWRVGFPARSTAVTADTNGDGSIEVVAACRSEVIILDGATGMRLRGLETGAHVGDIAAAEIDDVPGADIVFTRGREVDDTLAVLSGATLAELWRREAAAGEGPFARAFTKLALRDIDDDGRAEVLVAENGNRLLCMDGDGSAHWSAVLGECTRYHPEGVASSLPVVADLCGDAAPELAIGCFAGAVVVLDAGEGRELKRFQFGVESHESRLKNRRLPRFLRKILLKSGEPVNVLTAVELDGVEGPELVLGCSDGFLYALDAGATGGLWRVDTMENVYEPCVPLWPRVARAVSALARGADGVAEVGAAGRVAGGSTAVPADVLLAWDALGVYEVAARSGAARQLLAEGGGASSVLVGDIAGDGSLEVVKVSVRGCALEAWAISGAWSTAAYGPRPGTATRSGHALHSAGPTPLAPDSVPTAPESGETP